MLTAICQDCNSSLMSVQKHLHTKKIMVYWAPIQLPSIDTEPRLSAKHQWEILIAGILHTDINTVKVQKHTVNKREVLARRLLDKQGHMLHSRLFWEKKPCLLEAKVRCNLYAKLKSTLSFNLWCFGNPLCQLCLTHW